MQIDNKLINPFLTAALALGLLALAPATYAAFSTVPSSTSTTTTTTKTTTTPPTGMEKCYGIAKTGMNDCDPGTTCIKSIIDNDPNYFLYVPKGLCAKIAGGMPTPTNGGMVQTNTDMNTNVNKSFGSSDDMSQDNGDMNQQ